jgi:hypothetical protein
LRKPDEGSNQASHANPYGGALYLGTNEWVVKLSRAYLFAKVFMQLRCSLFPRPARLALRKRRDITHLG